MSSQPYTHFRLIARKLYGSEYNTLAGGELSDKIMIGEIDISGIKENTNVVSLHPPARMTSNITTISGDIFIASSSSELNTDSSAWKAFDNSGSSTSAFVSKNEITYNSVTGICEVNTYRTVVSNSIVTGEWIQIQLPYRIYATGIYISARNAYTAGVSGGYNGNLPQSLVLAGSNNGLTWTKIYENINYPYTRIEPSRNDLLGAFTTIDLQPYTLYLSPKDTDTLTVLCDAYTDLSANGTDRALVNYVGNITSVLIPSTNINLITGTDLIKFIAVSNKNRIIYNYSYENQQRLDNFTYYIVFSLYENASTGAQSRSLFVGCNSQSPYGYITNSLLVTVSGPNNNIFVNNTQVSTYSLSTGDIHFLIVSVDLNGNTRCILNNNPVTHVSTTTRVGFPSFCINGFYANNASIASATSYDRIYEFGIFEQDMHINSNDLLSLQGYLIRKYFFPRSIRDFKSDIIRNTNDIYFNDTSFNITGGTAPTQYKYYTDLSNYSISTLNWSSKTPGTIGGVPYDIKVSLGSERNTASYAFIETVNNRFSSYTPQYLITDSICKLNKPVIRYKLDTDITKGILYIKVYGEFIRDIAIRVYTIQGILLIGPVYFKYTGGDIEYSLSGVTIKSGTGYFIKVTASNDINTINYKEVIHITDIQETSSKTTTETVEYILQNRQINTNTASATNVKMISDISNIYIAQQRGTDIIVSVLSKPGLDQYYDYYRFIFPSIYNGDRCIIKNISISGQLLGTSNVYELPPMDMTSSSQSYTSVAAITGTYTISGSSSVTNSNPYEAFNTGPTYHWESAANTYLYGDYISNSSTQLNGKTICGEWLQLQLPYKFKLSSMTAFANKLNNGIYVYDPSLPEKIIICGSNDGINWNEVYYTSLLERKGDLAREYVSITNIEPYASQYVLNNSTISSGNYTLNSIACGVALDGKNYLFIGNTTGELGTLTNVIIHRYDLPDLTNLTIFHGLANLTHDSPSSGMNTTHGEETNLQLVFNSTDKLLYAAYQLKFHTGTIAPNNQINGDPFTNIGYYNIIFTCIDPIDGTRKKTKIGNIQNISVTGKDNILTSAPVVNGTNYFISYTISGSHEYRVTCIPGTASAFGAPVTLTISGYNPGYSSIAAFNKDLIYFAYENTYPGNNKKFIVVNPISVNSSVTTLTLLKTFLKLYDEDNTYNCANPSIICTSKRLFLSYETRGGTSINTVKSANNETDIAIACINIDSSRNLLLDNILQDKSLNSWGENKLSTLYYDSTTDRLFCTWLTNSATVNNYFSQTSSSNYDVASAQIKYTIIPSNNSIYNVGVIQNNSINTVYGYNYTIRSTLVFKSNYYICHTIDSRSGEDMSNNLYITRYTINTTSTGVANNTVLTNPIQIRISAYNKKHEKSTMIGITDSSIDYIIIASEVIDDSTTVRILKISATFTATNNYNSATASVNITDTSNNSNPQLMLYSTNYIYCLYDSPNETGQNVNIISYNYSLTPQNFPTTSVSYYNLSIKLGISGYYSSYVITIKAIMHNNNIYHLFYDFINNTLYLYRMPGNITDTSTISALFTINNYNVYNYVSDTTSYSSEDIVVDSTNSVLYLTYLKQFTTDKGIQSIIAQLDINTLTAKQTQLTTYPFKCTTHTLNTKLGIILNNSLFAVFNTTGNTSTNFSLDPVENDIVLARVDISGMGSSQGSVLSVSDIIQNYAFNTYGNDKTPFIDTINNVIIVPYITNSTVIRGSRSAGTTGDEQIAIAIFNVGNIPFSMANTNGDLIINYGLYKSSRIVIKSNDTIVKNVAFTNN